MRQTAREILNKLNDFPRHKVLPLFHYALGPRKDVICASRSSCRRNDTTLDARTILPSLSPRNEIYRRRRPRTWVKSARRWLVASAEGPMTFVTVRKILVLPELAEEEGTLGERAETPSTADLLLTTMCEENRRRQRVVDSPARRAPASPKKRSVSL